MNNKSFILSLQHSVDFKQPPTKRNRGSMTSNVCSCQFFVLFFIHGFEMISKRVSVRNILGLIGTGRRSAWRKLGMFNNVIFLQGIMCLYMLTHEKSNCFFCKKNVFNMLPLNHQAIVFEIVDDGILTLPYFFFRIDEQTIDESKQGNEG